MSELDLKVDSEFVALLLDSHFRLVGRRLELPGLSPAGAARWLYHDAPFSVLAHDPAPDPTFIYANLTAQRLFGYNWVEFIALPSRETAGPWDRAQRAALLKSVRHKGFVTGYHGIRVRRSGELFEVENLTLWNLVDGQGKQFGQAAAFPV
ncbi:MEKHLA domain-containing protein [Amycolatopsis sp. cmx-11-12]|uniref:MEKHLA domain-containing protein n=1 Tax=Amycolatopsis sp. cmx-11-12 TaxID=2785795 RepID=UPI003917E49E